MTDRVKWLICYAIGVVLTGAFFWAIQNGWMPYISLGIMVVFVWSVLTMITHQVIFVWAKRLK